MKSTAPQTKTTKCMEYIKKPKPTVICYNKSTSESLTMYYRFYLPDKGLNIDSIFTTKVLLSLK